MAEGEAGFPTSPRQLTSHEGSSHTPKESAKGFFNEKKATLAALGMSVLMLHSEENSALSALVEGNIQKALVHGLTVLGFTAANTLLAARLENQVNQLPTSTPSVRKEAPPPVRNYQPFFTEVGKQNK